MKPLVYWCLLAIIVHFCQGLVSTSTWKSKLTIQRKEKSKLCIIKRVLDTLETYEKQKEQSRNLRRTIYQNIDWLRHRSSHRYFRELFNLPGSIIMRSLATQALAVALFSSFIVAYNLIVELKLLPFPLPILTFPSLPFTLTSSSLGLLLVFRTNAAYSRWRDARIYWAGISAKSFDLMRQSVAWMKSKKQIAAVARYTVAFSMALKWHLGSRSNEQRLINDLTGIMANDEIEGVLNARYKPQYILAKLTQIIVDEKSLISNVQNHMDRAIIELSMIMENCDRIFTSPIPLAYTRLTSRFLVLWLLTFPLSLYNEFRLHLKWVVPVVSFLNSMFLLGIEDLGVQIEEPFTILPLANICNGIQKTGQSLLQDKEIMWFEGVEGNSTVSYESYLAAKAVSPSVSQSKKSSTKEYVHIVSSHPEVIVTSTQPVHLTAIS
eukprot:gene36595-44393_t